MFLQNVDLGLQGLGFGSDFFASASELFSRDASSPMTCDLVRSSFEGVGFRASIRL